MSSTKIKKEIKSALTRKPSTHKGDYGRLFIIAGSPGMTGAAALACWGALRSGAGLITLGIPKSLNSIMEIKLTEVMTLPLVETSDGTLALAALDTALRFAAQQDVVVIGPGLSRQKETQECIRRLIATTMTPLVIDADGLNALEGHVELLAKIKTSAIITPHPREFARVFKRSVQDVMQQRAAVARQYSLKYNLTIVLKGHETIVAYKRQQYTNATGNPGLATGGSGDVLTGMIAAFVGQGITPFKAAQYAVFIHGLAADIAVKEKTQVSLIPTDLLEYLPRAFQTCGL